LHYFQGLVFSKKLSHNSEACYIFTDK